MSLREKFDIDKKVGCKDIDGKTVGLLSGGEEIPVFHGIAVVRQGMVHFR